MEWIKTVGAKELVTVACPHCDKVLNLPDDEATIRLQLQAKGKVRTLLLSAFWGKYESRAEGIEIRKGEVCTMLCPHCGKSLRGEGSCGVCGATTSIFKFGNGAIGICNRKGCQMHLRSADARITMGDRLALSVSAWGGPYQRL